MKNKLEDVLKSFNILTDEDIANGLKYFNYKAIKKNDFLIEEGKLCDWIAFLNSGILRNFYISNKGDEITYCLTFPNNFITAYSSFITNAATFENIHAVTDTEILIIEKKQYLKLIDSSENWLRVSKFLAEQSYVLMENRLLALQMESAEKRYNDLITNQPQYLQHIPLKFLASYLGITQRHLSRLRNKI